MGEKKSLTKKVKLIEFSASVLFTLCLLIFGILYGIILIISTIFLGWWGLLLFIALIIIAYRTPKYLRNWNHFKSSWRMFALKRDQPNELKNLETLRNKISAQLGK